MQPGKPDLWVAERMIFTGSLRVISIPLSESRYPISDLFL